jgi:hypothetical protein
MGLSPNHSSSLCLCLNECIIELVNIVSWITFENDCLLGYCAVYSGKNCPTFKRRLRLHHQALIAVMME